MSILPSTPKPLHIIGILATLSCGITLVILALSNENAEAKAEEVGAFREALVIGHRHDSYRLSVQYYITYRFTITDDYGEDVTITHEVLVNRDFYETIDIGSRIPIWFAPNNPRISNIQGNDQSPAGYWISGLCLIIGGLSGITTYALYYLKWSKAH